ncbi:hypothetical protein BKA62DRAFT_774541 [Auriculariales sp. MPI-PUGE-AT-0066]|nr:hypothetical protein BKA62DRAFT_774541 [Auriculariales sp. MPI-PUGE-AT-0066]
MQLSSSFTTIFSLVVVLVGSTAASLVGDNNGTLVARSPQYVKPTTGGCWTGKGELEEWKPNCLGDCWRYNDGFQGIYFAGNGVTGVRCQVFVDSNCQTYKAETDNWDGTNTHCWDFQHQTGIRPKSMKCWYKC